MTEFKDDDGINVTYPFGIFGKGYRLPDADAKKRLLRTARRTAHVFGFCFIASLVVFFVAEHGPRHSLDIIRLRYGLAYIHGFVPLKWLFCLVISLPPLVYWIIAARTLTRSLEPAHRQLTFREHFRRQDAPTPDRQGWGLTVGLGFSATLALAALIPVLAAPPANPETRALAWAFIAGMLALTVLFAILVKRSGRFGRRRQDPQDKGPPTTPDP